MPATAAVKTLASSFEGMGGALALSVIAFSVVFFVLAGLTAVIYGMRYVSVYATKAPKAAPAAPKAAAPAAAPAASAASSDDDELVAVIAAALAAQIGGGFAIRSILPAGTHLIGSGDMGWINSGRIENCARW